MPPATSASASDTFWQQTPTAPKAICRAAMTDDLCVLACGRRRTPSRFTSAAIFSRLRASASRSTIRAGVSISDTGAPISAGGRVGILATDCLQAPSFFGEDSIGRTRKAEMVAQRRAGVFLAEDTTALQLGHDLVRDVVEPLRQVGKHHIEAVAAFGDEPFFHRIGDGLRRADEGEPAIAAEPLRKLA